MTGAHGGPDATAARAALDELGRVNLAEESMQSLLTKVADLAKRVMPGDVEVSVTLMGADTGSTAAFTGRLAVDLDEVQYGRGYGPCLEAAAGEVIEIVDARTEDRWPDYVPAFLAAGALTCLCVPIPAGQMTAALNIYARQAQAFSEEGRQIAVEFAGYAAVAISNLGSLQGARALAENLQAAMDHRAVIEQAKGILIERYKLTADQAFRVLADASMNTNTKLRDLADRLVHTGEFPAGRRRPAPRSS